MSTLTIPNSIVAGTPINSNPVNVNFAAIATWANGNVDNTNIGAGGIFASQIKATVAGQAQFGATATGVGYKFVANDLTAIPLIVSGVSGQNVDLFDVTLTSGGTKALFVDSLGKLNSGGIILTATPAGGTGGQVFIQNDQGATNGLQFNVPTGSTNGFRFTVNGVNLFSIDKNGIANFADTGGGAMPNTPSITGSGAGGLIFNNTTGQNFFFSSGAGAGTNLGNISGTTGVYTATSDARLKENVGDLTLGLTEVLRLRPVSFNWIKSKAPSHGFIAQEVQAVVPYAVAPVDEKGNVLGISDALLTPVVIKALQQFYAEFKAYEAAHP